MREVLAGVGFVSWWAGLFVIPMLGLSWVVLVAWMISGPALVVAIPSRADRRTAGPRYLPMAVAKDQVRGYLRAWREVYGERPQGLASDAEVSAALRDSPADDPVAIVASHDRDALGCLAINGVPARLGVVLVHLVDPGDPVEPAGDLAVLFLHDASAEGVARLAEARARWSEARVIDVGLTAAQARYIAHLPVLRGPASALDARVELDQRERAWLAAGHSVALAALAPARLIAMVERAVADLSAADSERLRARLAGFV